MAATGSTSPSKKRYYEQARVNHTREKNKIRKLRKYLKEHPNNLVAHKKLQELQAEYRV